MNRRKPRELGNEALRETLRSMSVGRPSFEDAMTRQVMGRETVTGPELTLDQARELAQRWATRCKWCIKARNKPECMDTLERPDGLPPLTNDERAILFAWVRGFVAAGGVADGLRTVFDLTDEHAMALCEAAAEARP